MLFLFMAMYIIFLIWIYIGFIMLYDFIIFIKNKIKLQKKINNNVQSYKGDGFSNLTKSEQKDIERTVDDAIHWFYNRFNIIYHKSIKY